ncbi:MAG: hypothetical protein RI988_3817 [Pseudomonadota bacterium]|jgi:hypothetical protein
MQHDLAALAELDAALARDAQEQARAERAARYALAMQACGEALL